MKTIIYKDILYNKNYLYWWLFFMTAYSILFVPMENYITAVFLSVFFANSFLLNILSENIQSGWFAFLLTTSAKRKTIVNSSFLEAFLLTIIFLIISISISIIVALFSRTNLALLFNSESILIVFLLLIYVLFVESLDIYIGFKYSVKTARTLSIIIYILAAILIFLAYKVSEVLGFSLDKGLTIQSALIIFVIFAVGIIGFYFLTLKAVNMKDF